MCRGPQLSIALPNAFQFGVQAGPQQGSTLCTVRSNPDAGLTHLWRHCCGTTSAPGAPRSSSRGTHTPATPTAHRCASTHHNWRTASSNQDTSTTTPIDTHCLRIRPPHWRMPSNKWHAFMPKSTQLGQQARHSYCLRHALPPARLGTHSKPGNNSPVVLVSDQPGGSRRAQMIAWVGTALLLPHQLHQLHPLASNSRYFHRETHKRHQSPRVAPAAPTGPYCHNLQVRDHKPRCGHTTACRHCKDMPRSPKQQTAAVVRPTNTPRPHKGPEPIST
jgi:hypothetical protein